MKLKTFLITASLGTCLLPISANATALSYSGMYVFGDSTVDKGNLYNLSSSLGLPFPPSTNQGGPYYQGRFSDGPVWTENLSQKLGIQEYNFAYGGSGSGDFHVFPQLSGQVGLNQQVGGLLNASPTLDANALYVLSTGTNDYLYNDASISNVSTVVGNITNAVSKLKDAGAKNFLVLGLPFFSALPVFPDLATNPLYSQINNNITVGPSDNRLEVLGNYLNGLIFTHNTVLQNSLAQLNTSLGINTNFLDVNGPFGAILSDPASFGFNNVSNGCLDVDIVSYAVSGGGSLPQTCSNPDKYLFFDRTHPSATTHGLIANVAYQTLQASVTQETVPEPLTMLGAATALGFGSFFKGKLGKTKKRDQAA